MLDQMHWLAAVTVLGVLEQGRDHWMHVLKYWVGQSTLTPVIFFCFHI